MMHDQCGQMEMPASQDCCAKAPAVPLENAMKSNPVRFDPVATLVLWVASFHVVAQDSVTQAWIQSLEHCPPKSPPIAITVLRI
jgi:hypothetical protein